MSMQPVLNLLSHILLLPDRLLRFRDLNRHYDSSADLEH